MDRYLVLQNGSVLKGEAMGAAVQAGADRRALGEVVFTTGMTGYLETLSDPCYHGQIVVQTFPLIGNCGFIPPDLESDTPRLAGYIVKNICRTPSNFRSEGTLDAFLRSRDIPGLCAVDTRALTLMLRESGGMNGVLTDDPCAVNTDELKAHALKDAVARVSRQAPQRDAAAAFRHKVALWDFGAKDGIRRRLVEHRCEVISMPAGCSAGQIGGLKPDGVLLSSGPGDPAENTAILRELKTLLEYGIPTFGIGLGHQLLALACGAKIGKLRCGHRGAGYPVRDTATGRVYITSQNHGYVVLGLDSATAALRWENVNDGTCEGIDCTAFPAFSVQFQPEAAAGPRDTDFLFGRFVGMMDAAAAKRAARPGKGQI